MLTLVKQLIVMSSYQYIHNTSQVIGIGIFGTYVWRNALTRMRRLKKPGEEEDTCIRNYSVDIIFLYFCKTFDTVPHCNLLKKLSSCGVCGNLNFDHIHSSSVL